MPQTETLIDNTNAQETGNVQVARTAAEIEALRPAWELLNRNPNSQVDFFALINSVRPSILRPHVITVRQDGQIKGLAVGRIVKADFNSRLGYKTISLGSVRQLDVVHGGLLGVCAGEAAPLIIDELLAALGRQEADIVNLSHIQASSPCFRLARQCPRLLCRDFVVQTQLHRKAKLPDSLEGFLGRLSKKHRAWARRMEKLLNTDFPGKVHYQRFAEYGDLDELACNMEAVARKTYQRELGSGFVRSDEQLQRLALGRRQDWLRGIMLHVDEQPCAFWLGSLYRGIYFSEATGFDPAFRKYEVGTQSFLKLVEGLCGEGVQEIDFGLGDALYKQRFGDAQWEEGSVPDLRPHFQGPRTQSRTNLVGGAGLGSPSSS